MKEGLTILIREMLTYEFGVYSFSENDYYFIFFVFIGGKEN